jgi:shikimate dehydrogenase
MADLLEKKYCVIGHPIGHSLSPQIHGTVFRFFGLDLEYDAVDVPPDHLAGFVHDSRIGKRPGFNVTIPHKQSIIPLLDETDALSGRIGAVNTVVLQKDRLIGYNTDVQGAVVSLKNSGLKAGGSAFILGAGGAARAALEALAMLKISEVMISDLLADRLSDFKEQFQRLHSNMAIHVSSTDSQELIGFVKSVSLFINATPVGMWPKTEFMPFDPSLLSRDAIVFDLVPRPVHTLLLKKSSELGMKTVPGIQMLIAQALESDHLYLNRPIPASLHHTIEQDLSRFLEEKSSV